MADVYQEFLKAEREEAQRKRWAEVKTDTANGVLTLAIVGLLAYVSGEVPWWLIAVPCGYKGLGLCIIWAAYVFFRRRILRDASNMELDIARGEPCREPSPMSRRETYLLIAAKILGGIYSLIPMGLSALWRICYSLARDARRERE